MKNGMTMFYAATDKNMSKAAQLARRFAYTENDSSIANAENLLGKVTTAESDEETERAFESPSFSDLPVINPGPRYVGDDGLRLRSAPGLSSNVIGSMNKGTEVQYTGRKTEEIDGHLWAEVEYDGKTGWVAADNLKISKPDVQGSESEKSNRVYISSAKNSFTNYLEENDKTENVSFDNAEFKPISHYSNSSLLYKDNEYSIFVPGTADDLSAAGWETVEQVDETDFDFDWIQFISGIQLDDMNGVLDASNINTSTLSKHQLANAGVASILGGVLNSAANSSKNLYLSFVFQEKGDQKRVIILAGSNDTVKLHNEYADGTPISVVWNYDSKLMGAYSYDIKKYYEDITGKTTNFWDVYDIQITLDPERKNSKYSSCIWIDANGNFIETPIIYKNDRVELGKRTGIMFFEFEPLINLSPYWWNFVSPKYQKIFKDACISDNISVE